MEISLLFYIVPGVILFIIAIKILVTLRRVVPTNEVHVLQGSGKTKDYGAKTENGTAYYAFPSWLPVLGVTIRPLPISNFTIELDNYEAYDQGKVPFDVTVKAFFRIEKATEAAARVKDFAELQDQLLDILQGAIRSILAEFTIEDIMVKRNEFGEKFSAVVDGHLAEWGVKSVKNIELMDIRDAEGSKVITNIQDKNRTKIEMQSRIEVAKNNKTAQIAEIEAQRETQIKGHEANESVGKRDAERALAVGVAQQKADQSIKEAAKITKEKEMAVLRVNDVKSADIAKEVIVVQARAEAERKVVAAKGEKEQNVTIATGQKESEVLRAAGISATGKAEADVIGQTEKAKVSGQIELASKISALNEYMDYQLGIKNADIAGLIGKAQAEALSKADVKILATGKDGGGAVNNVLDALTTPAGGAKIGAMVDAFQGFAGGKGLADIIKGATKGGVAPTT